MGAAGRDTGEQRARARPGRAAQGPEGLVVDTEGAVSAGPREGPEELELRGGLGDAVEDVINVDMILEPVDTGDIEALGKVVGNLNKPLKIPMSRYVSDGLAEAKECLAGAEADLDGFKGSVSLGDVEKDVIEEERESGDIGDIKAMEAGVSDSIKPFKTLVFHEASEGSAKAKDCLAKAEAKLDRLEGFVSVGDVEEDVCLLFDEEIGVVKRQCSFRGCPSLPSA